jgi:hypothetical protein
MGKVCRVSTMKSIYQNSPITCGTLIPLAQQRLEIDLDDGVKTNYLKFEGAVQPIPGLPAKED